jgi:predicted GIY-YIG superfamily endonuclease
LRTVQKMPRRSCKATKAGWFDLALFFSPPSPYLPPCMKYVYILQSVEGGHHYVGLTDDLRARLQNHNAGRVPHTSKHRPWNLKTYLAFSDSAQAMAFEKCLKSPSGRAFAKKRL